MTGGVDEVEAAVDAVVHYVPAVETTLVRQVLLKLTVYVADDGLEAVSMKTEHQYFFIFKINEMVIFAQTRGVA